MTSSTNAETIVGWRTDGSGRYAAANPPTKWSKDENVLWKTELPGNSFGSPVLVGGKVFVVSDPAELICLNAADGKILWQRSHTHVELYGVKKGEQIQQAYADLEEQRKQLQRDRNELRKANPQAKEKLEALQEKIRNVEKKTAEMKKHSAPPANRGGSGNSAATPVTDGKHVYAVFGNGIVSAHDSNGRQVWMRFVEGSHIGFGHSSSPVLADGKVIVHFRDLVALDAATGREVWRVELPARHATPIASRIGDDEVLIAPSGAIVSTRDGKILAEKLFSLSECSAVVGNGIVYAQGGKTLALRLPGALTDAQQPEVLWEVNSSRGRRTPSPVLHKGLLYGVTTQGILDVTDAESGQSVYKKRIELGRNIYSSVTACGDHLYISSTSGDTLVLKAGQKYQEIARNKLDSLGSNPVFIDQRMYLRTRKHLYCIGK